MAYPLLNTNEIIGSLVNMIISQTVFGSPIAHEYQDIFDDNRVDGGLYGDTKTYTSTDVGKSYAWGADSEAGNLLKLSRPTNPAVQAITVDQFRQIAITVDYYLTKRAWTDEGKFSEFTSAILAWLTTTKEIYETTLFNSYFGTEESDVGAQMQIIQISAGPENKEAEEIANGVANLIDKIKDYSRAFNDNGFLRSYKMADLEIVWPTSVRNKLKYVDLPTIYNDEELKKIFVGKSLPDRYFGTVNEGSGTTPSPNTKIRSLMEIDYNVVEQNNEAYDPTLHIFPGDLLPASKAYGEYETYTEDNTILCKITTKGSMPMMSTFSSNTSFFNARSLTETQFLTWGYSEPEHLNEKPFITVRSNPKVAAAQAKTTAPAKAPAKA